MQRCQVDRLTGRRSTVGRGTAGGLATPAARSRGAPRTGPVQRLPTTFRKNCPWCARSPLTSRSATARRVQGRHVLDGCVSVPRSSRWYRMEMGVPGPRSGCRSRRAASPRCCTGRPAPPGRPTRSCAAGPQRTRGHAGRDRWRVGGERHWLWAFVTPDTTVTPSAPAGGSMMPPRCWGPTTSACSCATGGRRIAATTDCKTCLNHLLQRCKQAGGSSRQSLGRRGAGGPAGRPMRDRCNAGALSEHGMATARGRLNARLGRLIDAPPPLDDAERFAGTWPLNFRPFLFLWDPSLDAKLARRTGHPARRGIRGVRRQPHPPRRRHPAGPSSVVRTARQRNLDLPPLIAGARRRTRRSSTARSRPVPAARRRTGESLGRPRNPTPVRIRCDLRYAGAPEDFLDFRPVFIGADYPTSCWQRRITFWRSLSANLSRNVLSWQQGSRLLCSAESLWDGCVCGWTGAEQFQKAVRERVAQGDRTKRSKTVS